MKSKLLIGTLFAGALLSGCAAPNPSADYCDVATPLYFEHVTTVDWLEANDAVLLREIVVHNEQHGTLCP